MEIKTIYVADIERIFVDCLTENLKLSNDFEVLGSSTNGATAYAEVRSLEPDLLITDLNLSDISGINLIRKIKASGSPTRVILLSSNFSPAVIHKALSAGVDGIILKYDHYSLLIEAISVIHMRKFLSPGISDPLVNNFLSFRTTSDSQRTSPLSDREEQVARVVPDKTSVIPG